MLLKALSGCVAAGCLVAYLRYRRFERFLQNESRAVKELAAAAHPQPDQKSVAELIEGCPLPLRRFFQRSLPQKHQGLRLWVASGSGALRFNPGGAWKRLDAETVGSVVEPAFCYTGSLQMGLGPLLWCRGREALLHGIGAMEWRLWGALPLARNQGGKLNQSALLRWLAEAVCFPPALLPSPYLRWEASDADPQHSVRAVATYKGSTVTATLTFDGEGRFLELQSDNYWRVMPDGSLAGSPWRARAQGHKQFQLGKTAGRIEVPTALEAAWLECDGSEFTHIRFEVTSIEAA